MRVALYGGSFNPPHVAHQLAALYVLETQEVDELWLVPCFKHPFEKTLAPFEDRLEMCQRAAAALGPRARVSDCEGRLGGECRTLRTVAALRAENPDTEFSLVIGADLMPELSSWYGAEELRRLVRFIVVGRAGFEGGSGPAMPAISSSEVRERLHRGLPVEALVPRSVLDYVRQRKLYGSAEPQSNEQ
jgi:nicotinate-nucleotide adenylyltransferase